MYVRLIQTMLNYCPFSARMSKVRRLENWSMAVSTMADRTPTDVPDQHQGGLGDLAAWHLPGGPVGQPASHHFKC